MQEKILKKILPAFAGPGAEKLVDLLYKKQNVNEFIIAKKLNLTINQTRNMLYKLSDIGLVEFIRKKDRKKGGWYTYFWTLKTKKILLKNKEELENELKTLNHELEKRKKERFYYCPSIDVEYGEEEAMLNNYICPETGEVLAIREPTVLINKIKSEISRLQNSLQNVNSEIAEIEKKEQKSMQKKVAAEKRKKDDERKKKRQQKAKEKKKTAKPNRTHKKQGKKTKKSGSKKRKKKR